MHAFAELGRAHLADGKTLRVAAKAGAVQLAQVCVDVRAVGVELAAVGMIGVVGKFALADEVDDVEAEAMHAFSLPKADDVGDFLAHIWVRPVEVCLGNVEKVQVILADFRRVFPGAAAEFGLPVGRRAAVGLAGAEQIIGAVFGVASERFLEPLVRGRGVVEDHIEHDVDAARFRLAAEALKIGHRAVNRVNGAVIGDVVAVVALRRGINRIEPEIIHAERLQIIELADDARQVADAVAVAVAERFGINLVNDLVFEIHGDAPHSSRIPLSPRVTSTSRFSTRTAPPSVNTTGDTSDLPCRFT